MQSGIMPQKGQKEFYELKRETKAEIDAAKRSIPLRRTNRQLRKPKDLHIDST